MPILPPYNSNSRDWIDDIKQWTYQDSIEEDEDLRAYRSITAITGSDGASGVNSVRVNASGELLTDTNINILQDGLVIDTLNVNASGDLLTYTNINILDDQSNIIDELRINSEGELLTSSNVAVSGEDVDVQHPFPTDGDSVYVKDLDIPNCDNGDFSAVEETGSNGSVADYFDSLTSINRNSTSDNPKTIKLWFKRTIYSHAIGFGCNDLLSGFGDSITIKLLGSGEEVRYQKTFTGVNPNSFLAEFGPKAFNGVILEFNTSDTICLSNITIQKSIESNTTIHGLTPSGNVKDVNVTPHGNLTVAINEYGDTSSIDSFARLRVSNPFTLFDSKQLHDKQPLFWDELTGGNATSIHSSVDSEVAMTVTASSSDFVIRQTKRTFNYQPGKSQLVLMSFQTPLLDGVIKRIGIFNGTGVNYLTPLNGVFFEISDSYYWKVAKNGVTTETVSQSAWNVDPFDGSGPSKINLDTQYIQILVIDYEWLGVGRVRVGFLFNGLIYYCHYFNHANNGFTSVYMSTPNIPLRYDIQSDGSSGCVLKHICSTVMSEGGQEEIGILRSIDNGTAHLDANNANTTYAVLGIRLKTDRLDVSVIPEFFSMIVESSDNFRWSLCLNPTVNGLFTYTSLVNSSVERAIGVLANSVSNEGLVIDSGYVATGNIGGGINRGFNTSLRIGSTINGTRDSLVLCVTPLTSNADVHASLTFRELL